MMKNVRAAQINIRSGKVDFQIDVVRSCGRIDFDDPLVVRAIDKPAGVCGYCIGYGDRPLYKGRARNSGQVDMRSNDREAGPVSASAQII
jgi:hypothetical protein